MTLYSSCRTKTLSFAATLSSIFFAFSGFAQNYKEEFAALVKKQDTTSEKALLTRWEKANQNDPDLYISYYNYYALKSKREILNMSTAQTGDKSIQLNDPKTGKVAGYINEGEITYDRTLLNQGFSYIDKGIAKFPDRLDMRFGKVYMLGQAKDFNGFTAEIIKTIDYGKTIDFKWRWSGGKPLDEPDKFMLSTIQDYFGQLYEAGDRQLDNMLAIATENLKYFPESVENLSNVAVIHMLRKEYDAALPGLLKAEKIAPQDGIVLNNIAFCYFDKNDKPNAIKYYELVLKYGDEKGKQYAQSRLKELKSN